MGLFWGDIHAHCAVSYGKGTPERAIDIAHQHLDFCSITGHAFWPDMPMDLAHYDHVVTLHLAGFAKLRHYWKDLLSLLREATIPGRFVAFPSYEWHSMEFGDHNCYFNSWDARLTDGPDVDALERNLRGQGMDFMMLPHHCGYVRGFRGVNWDVFRPDRSPLVEIYSNHGAAEADDAYYEYHHSMGPRVGESMIREGLQRGHRFGFIASTDNHDGYPGHYGHGRVGVFAERLDADSIWEAFRKRRTIAATGAKIAVDTRLGTGSIGETVAFSDGMPLLIQVTGTAPIHTVEIVEGTGDRWQVRRLPVPALASEFTPGRYKVKIEAGWGRGTVSTDWHIEACVRNGDLMGCDPCFRNSATLDGENTACDEMLEMTNARAAWRCRSMPNAAGLLGGTHFSAGGPQSVVLDIAATEETRLVVTSGDLSLDVPLPQLAARSTGRQTAGIGSTALKVHRAIPEREYSFRYQEPYTPLDESPGFLYLRVTQVDGQMAWASPVWYE